MVPREGMGMNALVVYALRAHSIKSSRIALLHLVPESNYSCHLQGGISKSESSIRMGAI
jgi:hypothetical protein